MPYIWLNGLGRMRLYYCRQRYEGRKAGAGSNDGIAAECSAYGDLDGYSPTSAHVSSDHSQVLDAGEPQRQVEAVSQPQMHATPAHVERFAVGYKYLRSHASPLDLGTIAQT